MDFIQMNALPPLPSVVFEQSNIFQFTPDSMKLDLPDQLTTRDLVKMLCLTLKTIFTVLLSSTSPSLQNTLTVWNKACFKIKLSCKVSGGENIWGSWEGECLKVRSSVLLRSGSPLGKTQRSDGGERGD